MGDLRFDWDPAKAGSNLRKHGVAFEDAVTVFTDPVARTMDDPDHSQWEARFLLLGRSWADHILVVSYTYRRGADVIRIISARRADRRERAQYGAR